MNNLLKIIVLFFASIVLFTSCKTSSITKRHYNKGYYVSHSHKKKTMAKKSDVPAQMAKTETTDPEFLTPKTLKDLPKKEELALTSPAPDVKTVNGAKKIHNSNSTIPSSEEIQMDEKIHLKELAKQPWKLGKMAAKDPASDALSLIWILIVVLLIVYIVGLLLDGFGLGGIIHILGVVILVLLVLWLLRLI